MANVGCQVVWCPNGPQDYGIDSLSVLFSKIFDSEFPNDVFKSFKVKDHGIKLKFIYMVLSVNNGVHLVPFCKCLPPQTLQNQFDL